MTIQKIIWGLTAVGSLMGANSIGNIVPQTNIDTQEIAIADLSMDEYIEAVRAKRERLKKFETVRDQVEEKIVEQATQETTEQEADRVVDFEQAQSNLLDLIASMESGGDYNIVFWGATSQPTQPLTTMTVSQARQYQQLLYDTGASSTAIGKYQIIDKTMDDIIADLSLDGTELFDESMQDTMAISLMNKRGYNEYLYEHITRDDFANNLAMEWASLPVVAPIQGKTVGQSYYAGDGLNASHVSIEAITQALDNLFSRSVE